MPAALGREADDVLSLGVNNETGCDAIIRCHWSQQTLGIGPPHPDRQRISAARSVNYGIAVFISLHVRIASDISKGLQTPPSVHGSSLKH
jgi:hypothetical protein